MALFKIFGNFASGNTTLPTSTTQGYCYFDKNTGKFYIDTATSETAELGTNRLALNADKADKDGAGNSIINTYLTKTNGLTNVSLNTSTRKLQKTINGTTSDITTLAIVPGTGTNSAVGGLTGSDTSIASGEGSFAFGSGSKATAKCAVAMGLKAEASAIYAVAIGGWHKDIGATTASGIASLATGLGSLATAPYAVAIGHGPQAKSFGGVAIGSENSTEGIGAVSFGQGTKAQGKFSFVIGKYNIPETNLTYSQTAGYGYTDGNLALIIGNGTADDARSNALTVDWNGNTTIAGSLTLNGTTTITATDISNWNNNSVVSISPTLTSGTKIGTITIDGTSTDLYSETNTDTKVTQNAVITTAGEYPVILANSTATTAITDTVNKTSTLTYNPNTQILTSPKVSVDNIYVGTASYGDTLPTTGTTGQIFFVEDNEEQGETVTTADISNWNNKSTVSITPNLTSGTKIGTITIDGTSTDLYSETNTDTKVTQNTAITTTGDYPILLGNSTATTAITDTVNKTSTLTYNPSTRNLNVPSIMTDEISFNQGLEITDGHCILHLNEEIDQDTYRNKFVYAGNHYISMIDLNESFATIETNPYDGQNPGAYMCVYTDEVKAGLQNNSGGHLKIGSYGASLIYGDLSSSSHSYISVTDDTMVDIGSTAQIDLYAPNIHMGEDSQVRITKLSLPNASNSNTYSSGTAGQVLTTNGTNVYWGTVSTEDTKVNVSTRGTTKAYLLADTTAPTSTAAAHTAVAESDVYLDTTAGALAATTYKIAEAVTLQYNSTTQALDFIFA